MLSDSLKNLIPRNCVLVQPTKRLNLIVQVDLQRWREAIHEMDNLLTIITSHSILDLLDIRTKNVEPRVECFMLDNVLLHDADFGVRLEEREHESFFSGVMFIDGVAAGVAEDDEIVDVLLGFDITGLKSDGIQPSNKGVMDVNHLCGYFVGLWLWFAIQLKFWSVDEPNRLIRPRLLHGFRIWDLRYWYIRARSSSN